MARKMLQNKNTRIVRHEEPKKLYVTMDDITAEILKRFELYVDQQASFHMNPELTVLEEIPLYLNQGRSR